MNRPRAVAGFTLLEVLVALIIVAFGMGALMATLTSAADSVGQLRDKSFAEWVALNRISELRLANAPPSVGTSNGDVEYAGTRWRWTQKVERVASFGNLLRFEVDVSHTSPGGETAQPMLAKAVGFYGPSIMRTRGARPDWSGETLKQDALSKAQGPNNGPGGGGTGGSSAPTNSPPAAPGTSAPSPVQNSSSRQ